MKVPIILTLPSGPSFLPLYRITIERHAPVNLTRQGRTSAFLLQLRPVTFPSSFQGLSNNTLDDMRAYQIGTVQRYKTILLIE